MENLKFIISVSVMGLYASWGFVGVLLLGMLLETKVKLKQMDDSLFILCLLFMAIIYVGGGYLLGYILFTKWKQ